MTREQARGWVPPQFRGGFTDLWEAANELELTSHAYEGALYDNDGKPINFSGQYRTDFMTERANRFLRSAKGPFSPDAFLSGSASSERQRYVRSPERIQGPLSESVYPT